MQSMSTLSAQLAESEKTVRELEHQVQAANAQVPNAEIYPTLCTTSNEHSYWHALSQAIGTQSMA